MLRILVMGAGAIGCFLGGSLAAQGHRVTLWGRSALMDKIAADGLALQWPDQPAKTVFPQTTTSAADITASYDFVLLTVKAYDVAGAIAELSQHAALFEEGCIVAMQNGLGSEEQLAAAFGPERIIAGTLTIPIRVTQPGVIEVSKPTGGLGLAPLQPGPPVEQLAEALEQAGLTTDIYADYRAMKWSKMILNIINNASCAILDQPPTYVIGRPALFDLEIRAMQEAAAVMAREKIEAVNLPGYPVEWLVWLVEEKWLPMPMLRAVLRPFMLSGRGTKMPSLHIDLATGRPDSEISFLNGAIVQAGRRTGIATPVNQALTEILSKLVSGELAWPDYQHQPDKLLQRVSAYTEEI